MNQVDLQAQLAAGGLVATKARVDPNTVEQVVARRYGGEPLGDRVVVRLGAQRLGPAEDLAMEFLGLRPLGESKPIAQQQRRAMGFASWALITHPDNAKYALVLVKRIKAAARKAKSKPGHAWDQFMAMANELNRSVKDFLPPFWEEAARIYKDLGNVTYAGRALSKALEAERVHALPVDRGRRRDAVLEFALGGCLSGKALADYSKDLQAQFPPLEALETLRDLTIRRTMGGMPPIASAAKDLARLAQMAGQDADAEIDAFLEQVIASPAMARAPLQFWISVKRNVARIVDHNPAFAVWLLVHTEPQSSYYSDSPVWKWLDLLDQWKVLEYLGKPAAELPSDVEIPGGRARWLGRLMCVEASPEKRIFDVIDKAAGAILAEGQKVPIEPGQVYGGAQVDVDVLEHCLALGLEIGDLPRRCTLDFDGWLRADVDHPRRNSSLEHLLADDRLRAMVMAMMPDLVQRKATKSERTYGRQLPACRSFSEAAAGHPAIGELWLQFLSGEAQRLETGGLHDAERTLNRLNGCVDATTGKQFPEFTKRMAAIDMAAILQRTLIGGVLDEYGWQTLDAADDEQTIPSFEHRRSCTYAHFPYVTVVRDERTDVFSANGQEKRTAWPRKKTFELQDAIPVGRDTLLLYRDSAKSYNLRIMWLNDPEADFETDKYYIYWSESTVMQHGDGVFYGTRVLNPGDQQLPESDWWFSDGERFWTRQDSANLHFWNPFSQDDDTETVPTGLQEIDPWTGKRGRKSVPPWFESELPAGSHVLWPQSTLMPIPTGLSATPLGMRGGLLGWRVVRRRDGSFESTGIDGRRCVLAPDPMQADSNRIAIAMMDKPGTDRHWIITNTGELIDEETGIGLANLEGSINRYRFGQPLPLSAEFYHLMSVRSVASSEQLRQTSAEQAQALLQAGATEHEARKKKEQPGHEDPNRLAASAAVQQWLEQAPPRLVKGVARIARLAAEETISLAKIQARLTEQPQARPKTAAQPLSKQVDAIDEGLAALAFTWQGTSKTSIYASRRGLTSATSKHIESVAKFFAGEEVNQTSDDDSGWISILSDPAAAAWQRFWAAGHAGADQGVPVGQRLAGPWLDALQFLADLQWFDLPGNLVFYLGEPIDQPSDAAQTSGRRGEKISWLQEGGCRYVLYTVNGYQRTEVHVLAYAAEGECKPPTKITVTQTIPLRPTWSGDQARGFVAAVRGISELPLIDAGRLQAAAQRLRVSPIQLALAWMGNFRSAYYGQEKLTKELRAHYGWKLTDVKPAVAAMTADPKPLSLVSIGARLDPEGSIGPRKDQAFDRMVDAWAEESSHSVSLPPELLARFGDLRFGYGMIAPTLFIAMLSDPDGCEAIQPHPLTIELDQQGRGHTALAAKYNQALQEDIGQWFRVLDRAIWLVNYALPFGDPARRQLPALVDAVLRFLSDKRTTLPFGLQRTVSGYGNTEVDVDATLAKFTSVGIEAKQHASGYHTLTSDLIVGATLPPEVHLYFRPAKLTDDAAWSTLLAAAALTFGWAGDGVAHVQCAQGVQRLRTDDIQALTRWNRSDAIPEGTWDQAPRVSVPELVAAVAKRLKVSDDAAALYLQTLALPDPTASNIQRWNNWTAAKVKKAAEELVKQEHLVSAKRSRAGRTFFLPGGWEALKQPNLPIESWKLPLLGYENTDPLRGSWGDLLVCPRTAADQFQTAWNRVLQGDVPRYETAAIS